MHRKKSGLEKICLYIVIVIFILISGNYLIEFITKQQGNRYLKMQTELLNTKYKTNYKYFKIMSQDIHAMYQDNKRILSILTQVPKANDIQKNRLREELYLNLKKRYKRLKNMGVHQLHFHMPDNTSFLRMHKPETFGDNLSNIRESVRLTNKTKKMYAGFEIGRVTHGFRFVYPLFNKTKHIGSMEISFTSKKLINSVLDNFIVDSHFLISKEEINKKIFKDLQKDVYEPSLESKDFLLEKSTHIHSEIKTKNIQKSILNEKSIEKISKIMKTVIAFSASNINNHDTIIGSFIPIRIIQNTKTVAYLLVYRESDYLDTFILEKKYIKLLFVTITLLLFLFSLYAKATRDKLEEMAHFDKLTTLPNRAYFYIELEKELKRAKRLKQKLAVMFIDLDEFKAVNDTYGHNIGDNLLVDVSNRLHKSVRDIDIIARLGGDEFTVVLTNIQKQKDVVLIAEKIIKKLNENFIIDKHIIKIGVSIGISIYPEQAKDSDTLIELCDNAMYMAKKSEKICVILSTKSN